LLIAYAVLSLPIGHHPALRTRVQAFTDALLSADPPIPGLDATVVVPPRRLHLTLGVMSLARQVPPSTAAPTPGPTSSTQPDAAPAAEGDPPAANARKTLDDARALLASLRHPVLQLLERSAEPHSKLHVPLSHVDIMRPERGGLDGAHVLWAGPVRPTRQPGAAAGAGAEDKEKEPEPSEEQREWDRLWTVACEFSMT
jgi:activating signal cointegrator complex subunit 1